MTETNAPSTVAEFGDFRLEPTRRRLTRSDGQVVEITSKAFDALAFLVHHAGTPVTRSELVAALWPTTIVEDNSLSKLIVALRRALAEDDKHRYIATLPGRGYQFVAEVRRIESERVGSRAPEAMAVEAAPPARAAPTGERRGAVTSAVALIVAVSAAGAAFAWWRLAPPGVEAAAASSPLEAPVRVTQITAYDGYELAPTLSPDGETVAFSWDGERGNLDLYVTRIGSSGRSALTDAQEADRFPAWSPDGENIAFLRENGPDAFTLMVVPAAGGTERALQAVRFRPTAVWGSPPLAWTHTSDAVIFTTRSSEEVASPHHLHKLPLASGEPTKLTMGDGVYDTSPAVSADGRWLAFVRHDSSLVHARGTLMVHSLADSEPQEPIVVPMLDVGTATQAYVIHSPSWSPDSRYLSFVLGTDLLEWEVGASAPRLVYAGAGRLGGITLAGDLGALTMARGLGWARAVIGSVERSADIFALPLAGTTREAIGPPIPRFVSSAGDIHPRYSPDGRRVAFISARDGLSDVWVAAADGTGQRRVTDLRFPIVGYPRWSPDGLRIAFHAGDGSERAVYFVDPEAGVPQRITEGCCLEWSRDGMLYVTDFVGEHMISRFRLADGQRERLFAGGFPSLTADGQTLLYGKVGERNLYARAVDGDIRDNPERLLLTDSSYPSATAATAEGFFYVRYSPAGGPGQIRFYDYATRETRAAADVPTSVAELLTLAPDGTELMYGAQRESGADLWLLEFDATLTASP